MGFFGPSPGVFHPVPFVAKGKLPSHAALSERAFYGTSRTPRTGLEGFSFAPAFRLTACFLVKVCGDPQHNSGLSRSPSLWKSARSHWIECWDYFDTNCHFDTKEVTLASGLLQQASIVLDEPVSGHPALPGRPRVDELPRDLRPLVRRLYWLCSQS